MSSSLRRILAGFVLIPFVAISAASVASAAKPPKPPKPPKTSVVKDCAYFGDTPRATASVGRTGLTQTSGSDQIQISLSDDGSSVVFAPQGDYTVSGFVLDGNYTMVDPPALVGDTVSGTNPYTKGKAKNVFACGNYNPVVVTTEAEITFDYAEDGSVVVTYYMAGDSTEDLTYYYSWHNVEDPSIDVTDGEQVLPSSVSFVSAFFYAKSGEHIDGDLRVGTTLVDAFNCVVGTDCPVPTTP